MSIPTAPHERRTRSRLSLGDIWRSERARKWGTWAGVGALVVGAAFVGSRIVGSGSNDEPFQRVVPGSEHPLGTVISSKNGSEQAVLVMLPGGTLAAPVGIRTIKGKLGICEAKPLSVDAAAMLAQPEQVFAQDCVVEKTTAFPTSGEGVGVKVNGHGVTIHVIAGKLDSGEIPLTFRATVDK